MTSSCLPDFTDIQTPTMPEKAFSSFALKRLAGVFEIYPLTRVLSESIVWMGGQIKEDVFSNLASLRCQFAINKVLPGRLNSI